MKSLELCAPVIRSSSLSHVKSVYDISCLLFSENVLEFPQEASDLVSSFFHIKVLYVNRMNYTWEQVKIKTICFNSFILTIYKTVQCLILDKTSIQIIEGKEVLVWLEDKL